MEGWLAEILLWLTEFSTWVENFYDAHTGLVTIAGVSLTAAGAYFGFRALKPKPTGPSSQTPSEPLTSAERKQLLDRVQSERVDPRLRRGLREAIRVDLGLRETPGAVPQRLREYQRRENGPPSERTCEGDIRQIFDRMAGCRLLILGEPGTGKTNLLLELAKSLIADALGDESRPVPIVFSLPRWTLSKKVRTLAEWMQDDLAAEYGLSIAVAKALVERNTILPLLDGLDEVSATSQAACVEAIHTYQDGRPLGRMSEVAVCCREEEYEALPNLDLGGAIRIEKLERSNVEREVGKPGLAKVRAALDDDEQLWKLIDTPLWLHVLYGAAQAEPKEADKDRTPRDRLYLRYVDYALGREAENSPRRLTDNEQLKAWLGWLARQMQSRDQSQFSFENLDYSWLPTRRAQRAALAISALVVGLVGGLVFGLFVGLVYGLFGGLVVGLVVGLFGGPKGELEAMEELHFAPSEVKPALVGGLVFGLFVGLVFGLVFGLVVGLFVGLYSWLGDALRPRPVSGRTAPNRGTTRSLRYAVAISGLGTVFWIAVILLFQRTGLEDEVLLALTPILASLAWFGVVLGFEKGGYFALRHYAVRLFLWLRGLAPRLYVRFLNECTDRLFLIRRGGSYEFFHITFRDFMAQEYGPK